MDQKMICSWADIDLDFFVINVKKSERRRMRMEQQLSERGMRHRFIEAVDGDDTSAVRAAFLCDTSLGSTIFTHRTNPVTSRELACTLSHLRAVRLAHEEGRDRVIILEDDLEIGDVEASEIAAILSAAPSDAAYIQLCVLPAATVRGLTELYFDTQQLFARKKDNEPTRFANESVKDLYCHSTAAYLVTAGGMKNICENFFAGSVARFPCDEVQVSHNVGLAADRFVYQTAVGNGYHRYAYCIPTFILEGVDSMLHPHHVSGHFDARNVAQECRNHIFGKR